jgi:cation diffusion facilitator family transporter
MKSVADRGMKSAILGICVNFGLAIIKGTAGLLGHSFALVADGLESITDVFSGLAVYFGLKIAAKPPDADHPYGHGKAEPVAAVVVSLALVAAGLAIIYEGIREIVAPHDAPAPYTLVVLSGVLIVKELLFRYVAAVGDTIGSSAVKSDAWHHRSDALTSAFAFVGISIALLGGPGWEAADGWAAVGAALVILYNAWQQARPAILELSDIAPPPHIEAQISNRGKCAGHPWFGQVPGSQNGIQLLCRPSHCCRRRSLRARRTSALAQGRRRSSPGLTACSGGFLFTWNLKRN